MELPHTSRKKADAKLLLAFVITEMENKFTTRNHKKN
jgi:hypothetical protein